MANEIPDGFSLRCQFCRGEIHAPRLSICEDCERKWNAGARWADKHWHETPHHRSMDMDTSGMPLYGSCSREATHAAHFTARKDGDE